MFAVPFYLKLLEDAVQMQLGITVEERKNIL